MSSLAVRLAWDEARFESQLAVAVESGQMASEAACCRAQGNLACDGGSLGNHPVHNEGGLNLSLVEAGRGVIWSRASSFMVTGTGLLEPWSGCADRYL